MSVAKMKKALKPSPIQNVTLTIRALSQDAHEVSNVLQKNTYQLPERLYPKDAVIDIGANIGTFAIACLERGAGHVHCYEPDPANRAILRKNLGKYRGRYSISGKAVWGAGVKKAHLIDRGFLTSSHFAVPDGVKLPANTASTPVGVLSLDQVLTGYKRVRLLKLDCEGAEWAALHDLTRHRVVREIVAELHPTLPATGYKCTPAALCDAYQSRGFRTEKWMDEGGVNVMFRAVRVEG